MLLEVSVQFALATKLTTLVLDAGSCKDTIQSRNQNQCQHGDIVKPPITAIAIGLHISEP